MERLPKIGAFLAGSPERSISASCPTTAEAKSVYRFMSNARVSPGKCLAPHRRETLRRVAGHQYVLVVQDTTFLDYSTHEDADFGLYSPLPTARGVLVHNALAVADGVPLGILAQFVWTRPPEERGKKHQRKELSPEQKESHKWVEGLHQSIKGLPEGTKAIFVCDRESTSTISCAKSPFQSTIS